MSIAKSRMLLGAILTLALLAVPILYSFGSSHAWSALSSDGLAGAATLLEQQVVGRAYAEDSAVPRVKQMKVSIEPEYDEPRVLAIYDGQFADGVSFPRDVRFRVPAGAEISQVCGLNDKGDHLCQLYQTAQDGDYTVLTYNLPVPHFYLEYYFNPVGTDAVRNLAYSFSATYPTDKLDFDVQQPLRSTDFTLTPAPQSAASDAEGFKYSLVSYSNVNTDQKTDLKISYSKQDSRPSVAKKQQGNPSTSGGGSGDNSNLNLWAILGGSAVFATVAYYVVTRRPGNLLPQRAAYNTRSNGPANYSRGQVNARQAGRSKGAARGQAAGQFCTSCGAPIASGDRFCAGCGARSKGTR